MFKDILVYFNDDQYVYILDGCFDWFASLEKDHEECDICGETPWPVTEGYVRDLKLINNMKQLEAFEHERLVNKQNLTRTRTKNK